MTTTQAINANGDVVAPMNNNLNEDNELRATSRSISDEKIAKGHLNKGSAFISDEEMAANLDIVERDGMRQHVSGDHRPGDIISVNGLPVEYEMAVSLGLITSLEGEGVSPQEAFEADSETKQQVEPEANLEGVDLLKGKRCADHT